MAKSHTKRKSGIKPDVSPEQVKLLEKGINGAVQYIRDWKRKELVTMLTTKSKAPPVCVAVGKEAYVVGKYGVKRHGDVWQVYNSVSETENYFSCRASAIVYSVCEQTGRFKLARELVSHDDSLLRCKQRVETYNHLKAKAKKKRDYWRFDHYYIMSNTAEFELADAKHLLEKSLNLAKYFKIWE